MDILWEDMIQRITGILSMIHLQILILYPNSPGYRLILNNILFPAAKKKTKDIIT